MRIISAKYYPAVAKVLNADKERMPLIAVRSQRRCLSLSLFKFFVQLFIIILMQEWQNGCDGELFLGLTVAWET